MVENFAPRYITTLERNRSNKNYKNLTVCKRSKLEFLFRIGKSIFKPGLAKKALKPAVMGETIQKYHVVF